MHCVALETVGFTTYLEKRVVTKGSFQQYRQGNDQNNSRSYDVSIIAYWKKPNGYIETLVYKTRSLNLAEEVM